MKVLSVEGERTHEIIVKDVATGKAKCFSIIAPNESPEDIKNIIVALLKEAQCKAADVGVPSPESSTTGKGGDLVAATRTAQRSTTARTLPSVRVCKDVRI